MSSDQGPYTGQSMEIPQEPFQPDPEAVIEGYDEEGNPVRASRAEVEEEPDE